MRPRVTLRPEALLEIREATLWYAGRGFGLGAAFLDEVSRVLDTIRNAPSRYPTVDGDIRRVVLRRFPYLILYRALPDEVVVIACNHGRRDPAEWKGRL